MHTLLDIGQFWCETNQCWVRFEEERGSLTAKILRRSKEDPGITEDKEETLDSGLWSCFFSRNPKALLGRSFYLKDGKLYITDWSHKKPADSLNVEVFIKGRTQPARGNNPFSDKVSPNFKLCDKSAIALTPSQQKQKWLIWRKQTLEKMPAFIEELGSVFDSKQKQALFVYFKERLIDDTSLSPMSYENAQGYLQALNEFLQNEKNALRGRLKNLAATTVDDDILAWESEFYLSYGGGDRGQGVDYIARERINFFLSLIQDLRKNLIQELKLNQAKMLISPDSMRELSDILPPKKSASILAEKLPPALQPKAKEFPLELQEQLNAISQRIKDLESEKNLSQDKKEEEKKAIEIKVLSDFHASINKAAIVFYIMNDEDEGHRENFNSTCIAAIEDAYQALEAKPDLLKIVTALGLVLTNLSLGFVMPFLGLGMAATLALGGSLQFQNTRSFKGFFFHQVVDSEVKKRMDDYSRGLSPILAY